MYLFKVFKFCLTPGRLPLPGELWICIINLNVPCCFEHRNSKIKSLIKSHPIVEALLLPSCRLIDWDLGFRAWLCSCFIFMIVNLTAPHILIWFTIPTILSLDTRTSLNHTPVILTSHWFTINTWLCFTSYCVLTYRSSREIESHGLLIIFIINLCIRTYGDFWYNTSCIYLWVCALNWYKLQWSVSMVDNLNVKTNQNQMLLWQPFEGNSPWGWCWMQLPRHVIWRPD